TIRSRTAILLRLLFKKRPGSIRRAPDKERITLLMRKELHEENRLSWNAATVAHNSHKGDQAAFFRKGGSTLRPEELELLGDVRGQAIVHLQCNSGQDTLSMARLGAVMTGVDISDTAIDFARQLSQDSGIPAQWQRMMSTTGLRRPPGGSSALILFSARTGLSAGSPIWRYGRGESALSSNRE